MCGIAGFVSQTDRFDRVLLDRMRDALVHRGPDDAGTVAWTAAGQSVSGPREPAAVGLGHRRLSIIDLSPAGHQPMKNEDGSLWIAYNGEFYNFGEFRQELEKAGHRFASQSDTETILHLYEHLGLGETLKRMNGMFAFALWDGRRREMVLARDRLGKKPLYYVQPGDGSLVFASEMKALVAAGLVDRRKIDAVALDQFWTFGYTLGERTIYEQVRRLPPAHFAVWKDGELAVTEYWDCPFGLEPFEGRGGRDLADELCQLLSDAVRLRLISDVPVGLFLSGGIDSSLIAAITKKELGRDLDSYTVSFNVPEYDEAPHARRIAEHLELKNTVLTVNEDLAASFPAIVRSFDEPFGDMSSIPTYFLSKATREQVTVALSGDAGDELFAGYDQYRNGLRLWGDAAMRRVLREPRSLRGVAADTVRRLQGPVRGYCRVQRRVNDRFKRRLYQPDFLAAVDAVAVVTAREKWGERVAGADALSTMQYIDAKTYLPDDILVKVDRMSMAVSLECRSPFLDYRVVEFAARLPFEAKMDGRGRGKRILKALLGRYLPVDLFDRPKAGFTPPWERWCAGEEARVLRGLWRTMDGPYFRAEAADLLFPDSEVNAVLAWNGFSALTFFQSLEK